jgi:hypothetical protein
VSVSYRESIFYLEKEDPSGITTLWQTIAVSSLIKRRTPADSAVGTVFGTRLKRPNWFARDCVLAVQSRREKYLCRMCWSKGGWRAIFRDSRICGPIHFAHAARPELRLDFIAPEFVPKSGPCVGAIYILCMIQLPGH